MMWPLQSPWQYFQRSTRPPLHLEQLHIKLLHGDLTFILLISHESKVSFHRRWRRLTVKDVYALPRKMGAVITLWGGEFLSPSDITAHEYDLWKAVSQESRGGVQTWSQIFSPPHHPPQPRSFKITIMSPLPQTAHFITHSGCSLADFLFYYFMCLNWTLDLPAFTLQMAAIHLLHLFLNISLCYQHQ